MRTRPSAPPFQCWINRSVTASFSGTPRSPRSCPGEHRADAGLIGGLGHPVHVVIHVDKAGHARPQHLKMPSIAPVNVLLGQVGLQRPDALR